MRPERNEIRTAELDVTTQRGGSGSSRRVVWKWGSIRRCSNAHSVQFKTKPLSFEVNLADNAKKALNEGYIVICSGIDGGQSIPTGKIYSFHWFI